MSKMKFLIPAIVVVVVAAGLAYYYMRRGSSTQQAMNTGLPSSNSSGTTSPGAVSSGTEANFQATGNVDNIVNNSVNEGNESQSISSQEGMQTQQEVSADSQTINNVDGAYHDQEVQ